MLKSKKKVLLINFSCILIYQYKLYIIHKTPKNSYYIYVNYFQMHTKQNNY